MRKFSCFLAILWLLGCGAEPGGRTGLGSLTVGEGFACGLDSGGAAWCWGMGKNGQLGTGLGEESMRSVAVAGDHRFIDLCAGYVHACGLDDGGVAWCWGENWYGQLGNASDQRRLAPTRVETAERFKKISCGHQHTCALGVNGGAWCWGFLGWGVTTDYVDMFTPTLVDPAVDLVRIDGKSQVLSVVDAQGRGRLIPDPTVCDPGDTNDVNYGDDSPEPLRQNALWADLRLTHLCAGDGFACGLDAGGTWLCTGSMFYDGTCRTAPEPVASGRFHGLVCASVSACALAEDGAVWCMGENQWQVLGIDSPQDAVTVPAPVATARRFQAVAVNTRNQCAQDALGQAWCWGMFIYSNYNETLTRPIVIQ